MSTPKKRRKRRHYHTGTHQSPKCERASYRSGWELSYMQYLDIDETVLKYEYESLDIQYISNKSTGRVRHYWPDILVTYVDGRRVLCEIKPSRKVDQPTNRKKFLAAREWCSDHDVTFVIITEHELKELHIL